MAASVNRLGDFIPYLMSITTNAVSDLIAGEYRQLYGLKIPEWRVMAILGDMGARTQRDLVDATRMDKVAVNRACKELEGRDLIGRSPNLSDGRSHRIELTAAGRAMHAEIIPHALEMERKLLAALEPAERTAFKAMLARLSRRAGELEAEKDR